MLKKKCLLSTQKHRASQKLLKLSIKYQSIFHHNSLLLTLLHTLTEFLIRLANISHLYDLVEEASNINSITNGVYYNDDNDHEYDDAMTSLLVSEPQEFVRPP